MIDFLPYVALLVVVSGLALGNSHTLSWRVVAVHGLLMLAVLTAGVDVMGRPKPLWTEVRGADEIEVVAAVYHPGEGIYVWSRSAPPRAYKLPWDVALARKMQVSERASGGVVLKRRGDGEARRGETDSGEWTAHPLPQPRDKPKDQAR